MHINLKKHAGVYFSDSRILELHITVDSHGEGSSIRGSILFDSPDIVGKPVDITVSCYDPVARASLQLELYGVEIEGDVFKAKALKNWTPMRDTVRTVCLACDGTGLYRGMAEPEGIAVVCLICDGTGFKERKLFVRRMPRKGINTVRRSKGSFIATGVGPTGSSITYQEFTEGKYPEQ